ncbi:SDR family oxidoreductase [Paracoccus benzoatiresistens]|uniref:SDR family oxidoreductase n=1 Tax=Paracoccus benzoatiresistens TaxID=2997341 RepID=A0ABT4J8S4_9RHOB|nr:SDR family oxidoreductase [Paracoccus sp. EF6]MCZ0963080.1 SDR family oxidoreductase [Paracoccus sp. EF6]
MTWTSGTGNRPTDCSEQLRGAAMFQLHSFSRIFMPRLSGKTALVTGAASGIGAAIAKAFADEAAQVIVTDIDVEGGQAVADDISGTFVRLDVANEADWTAVGERFPALDVLVNNAGITGFEGVPAAHDPEHAQLADWRAVHAVNLDGTFLGCRYAIRAMRAKGSGSIINISSRSGLVGIPMAAAYASSKAAVRNHTKTVALYCAGQGLNIRCNSIHPAAVMTPMWEPMLGDGPDRGAREAAMVADTPMRRFGRAEEVAALAVLLASDEAAYMTGAELTIDGGTLAGSAATPGN